MTQAELLDIARKGKPTIRYFRSRNGNAIGGWSEDHVRVVAVALLGIDGKWYAAPYELLINDKPLYKPEDWIE